MLGGKVWLKNASLKAQKIKQIINTDFLNIYVPATTVSRTRRHTKFNEANIASVKAWEMSLISVKYNKLQMLSICAWVCVHVYMCFQRDFHLFTYNPPFVCLSPLATCIINNHRLELCSNSVLLCSIFLVYFFLTQSFIFQSLETNFSCHSPSISQFWLLCFLFPLCTWVNFSISFSFL